MLKRIVRRFLIVGVVALLGVVWGLMTQPRLGLWRFRAIPVPTPSVELATTLRWVTFYVEIQGGPSQISQGTAFIVHPDGTMLTAFHVLDLNDNGVVDRDEAFVTVYTDEGQRWSAEVTCWQPKRDVAAIQLRYPRRSNWPCVHMGQSENISPGAPVYLLGYDQEWNRATFRVAHVVGRTVVKGQEYFVLDTAAFPGASGGPVVTAEGTVIGVLTKRVIEEKLAFAVPSQYIPRPYPCFGEAVARAPLAITPTPSPSLSHELEPRTIKVGPTVRPRVATREVQRPLTVPPATPAATSLRPTIPPSLAQYPLKLSLSNFYREEYREGGTWFQLDLTVENVSNKILEAPWYPVFSVGMTLYYGKSWGGIDMQQQPSIGPGQSQTWAWGTIGSVPSEMVFEALGWRWTYLFKHQAGGQGPPSFEEKIERIKPGEESDYYTWWGAYPRSFPRPDQSIFDVLLEQPTGYRGS